MLGIGGNEVARERCRSWKAGGRHSRNCRITPEELEAIGTHGVRGIHVCRERVEAPGHVSPEDIAPRNPVAACERLIDEDARTLAIRRIYLVAKLVELLNC